MSVKASVFRNLCLGLLIAVFTAPIFTTPVYAVPPIPHAFYGDLTVNNGPAPVGTTVEARGEAVTTGITGNPIITTEVGKYGSANPLETKLIVQGEILEGATITFYVNGVSTGQTALWHSGTTTQLDLTVTIIAPTVTTNAATGIGTTTAILNGNLTNLGNASSVGVSFQWGTSTSYGSETSTQTMTSTGSFSATLSGLSSGTIYHFRAKAAGEGTSYGADTTFTTTVPPGAVGGAPAAPVDKPLVVETNLFGTGLSFSISATGEILETIVATSADGDLTITIPAGTIALDKDGQPLAGLTADVDLSPPDPPEGDTIIGLVYNFGPVGATFVPPITLTWRYDPDEIPEGAELLFMEWDDGANEWLEFDGEYTIDLDTDTITISVSHFSKYAIIAHPTPVVPVEEVVPAEEEEEVVPAEKEEEVVPAEEEEEEVAPPEEEEAAVPPPPAEKGLNWALIGGLIGVVVVAVALLVYFMVIRRRNA